MDSRSGVLAAANLFTHTSYKGRRLTLICDPTHFMSQTSKECAVPSPDQVGFGSTDADPFSIVLWTVGNAVSTALTTGLKVLAAGALSVFMIKLAFGSCSFRWSSHSRPRSHRIDSCGYLECGQSRDTLLPFLESERRVQRFQRPDLFLHRLSCLCAHANLS